MLIGVHALFLVALPFSWVPRYLLPLLALGGCALAGIAPVLTRVARRWVTYLEVALVTLSCVNTIDHGLFDVARIRTFMSLADKDRNGTVWDPGSFGASFQWISQHVPNGSTVAYGDAVLLPYPLWGSSFERRVIYVPASDARPYSEDLQKAEVDFVMLGETEPKTGLLSGDPRAQVVFKGSDGFTIYALQH